MCAYSCIKYLFFVSLSLNLFEIINLNVFNTAFCNNFRNRMYILYQGANCALLLNKARACLLNLF